ncbi:hypothetical protein KXD93_16665 [Mucilaginibacter sp. BJC16-A38]|uniref:hypothetical protein n=1 Tax=Mucilaginibacter phenanthrenivorans TaxID=1234842 RepID=UPI002157AB6A|nr:hypothetical protein [Mucilaginibacter phenanthrenivorans]MCR8559292.1 hypothetical protein [Mucilaginibacter phenanthrenivorans]
MEVIKLIGQALGNVLGSYFNSDMDVMSPEAKKIFSNEEDKKKYVEAVERLKYTRDKEETITLSTNEKITLVS